VVNSVQTVRRREVHPRNKRDTTFACVVEHSLLSVVASHYDDRER